MTNSLIKKDDRWTAWPMHDGYVVLFSTARMGLDRGVDHRVQGVITPPENM